MVGSLVADREKGTRHQLQMTGLLHTACVAPEAAPPRAPCCQSRHFCFELLHACVASVSPTRLPPPSYWIGSLIHDVIFQLLMYVAS
jgi:hypothetical protein